MQEVAQLLAGLRARQGRFDLLPTHVAPAHGAVVQFEVELPLFGAFQRGLQVVALAAAVDAPVHRGLPKALGHVRGGEEGGLGPHVFVWSLILRTGQDLIAVEGQFKGKRILRQAVRDEGGQSVQPTGKGEDVQRVFQKPKEVFTEEDAVAPKHGGALSCCRELPLLLGKGLRHGRKQVFLGLGHGLVAFLFNAEMPDFIVFSMQ